MTVKVQIICHSLHTHVYQLAEAVAAGAREVPGAEVSLCQVAETLSHEILEKMGAVETKKRFAHLPVADPNALVDADGQRAGHRPLPGPARRPARRKAGCPLVVPSGVRSRKQLQSNPLALGDHHDFRPPP